MKYETTSVNVKWTAGIIKNLGPNPRGCSRVVEEMARDGWVLISQTEHGGLIGFAHTKLVFRKIAPQGYY